MNPQERLDKIVRHINHVRDNCVLLGEKLIKNNEADMGRRLIANGYIHDNSKFGGIEWEYLHEDIKQNEPEKFELAVQNHITQNPHHPEYWHGIELMQRIYKLEMVCDWAGRASEFGTDLREWIKESATKKFKFSASGKIYKEIKEILDLLLDTPFK